MLWRMKKWASYLTILILLPYVITIFINGPSMRTAAEVSAVTVKVEKGKKTIDMDLDQYCIGRLAGEMPAGYEKEALKAQAILVRTAVYTQIMEEGSEAVLPEEYWTEKEMKENWGKQYASKYRRMKEAWEETRGQVLMYEESLADAPFCRLTNGSTRDGKEVLESEEYPYLKIKECPFDIESKEQIQTTILEDIDAEVTETDSAGYVKKVRVGEETMGAEEFRKEYQLCSSCFTLQHYDGKLRVVTRGVGHGLGMSQYTANRMAKNGGTCEEVLSYFFEGTRLEEVAEIVSTEEHSSDPKL